MMRLQSNRPTDLKLVNPRQTDVYDEVNSFRSDTHCSIIGLRKGNLFSILSIFAIDCTAETGITKKNVRKKKATAIISLLTVSET